MTLFEGEQNGRYETDHLHMVLNEHIDFTEEGLKRTQILVGHLLNMQLYMYQRHQSRNIKM